jgi:hypothetical protein
MSTNWTSPSTITQYAEDESHISWIDNFSNIKSSTGRLVSTTEPLLRIARQPRNDITMKTYFLKITGYNFQNLPEEISGIECRIKMNRGGRISDDTVQLCYQDNLIGENQAELKLDPITVYGSNTNTWKVALTSSMVQDSSFGVVVRFRSHPQWPHSTTPLIDTVELQIY